MNVEYSINAEKPLSVQASTAIETLVVHSASSSTIEQLAGWQTALMLADSLKSTSINIIHICQSNCQSNSQTQGENVASSLSALADDKTEIIKLSMQQLSFLDQLGINEKQLFTDCQAQHNLGHIYNGWSNENQCFALVDGEYGIDFENIEFHHYLSSLERCEFNKKIDDFSFAALMVKGGSFVHPVNDKKSILSTFTYSVNVELTRYCQLIRNKAIALGVQEYNGTVTNVDIDKSNTIQYVNCKRNGEVSKDTIQADFYFDCVKDSALTLNEKLNENLDTSRYSSPVDKMFSAELTSPIELRTSDNLTTYQFGYTKTSHVKNISIIQCYFNDKTSVDEVLKELDEHKILLNKNHIKVENLTHYLVTTPWQQNKLLLGRARASVNSIHNDFIDLLQQDITLWLAYFPRKGCSSHLAKYFNETSTLTYLSKQDFNQAHYLLSDWRDSSFWIKNRNNISISLDHTIDMYGQTGTMPLYESQFINEKKWCAFFMGFDYIPKNYVPLIDAENSTALEKKLLLLHGQIKKFSQKLPSYKAYLESMGFKNS
jgi:tryptophan halogenase